MSKPAKPARAFGWLGEMVCSSTLRGAACTVEAVLALHVAEPEKSPEIRLTQREGVGLLAARREGDGGQREQADGRDESARHADEV